MVEEKSKCLKGEDKEPKILRDVMDTVEDKVCRKFDKRCLEGLVQSLVEEIFSSSNMQVK